MKKFKFKINGSEYEVSVNEVESNVAEIEVNGTPFTVEIEKQEKSNLTIKPAGKVTSIKTPARSVVANAIKAPLPGSILKIMVTTGQKVKRGDVLLIMESMKMENNILAEHDGLIRNIHVQAGQSVMQDDILIDFEGADAVEVKAPAPNQPATAVSAVSTPKPAGMKAVKSPLPGVVLKVAVSLNQQVKRGDLLMTLESMKMENSILCEKDAVVKAIHVKEGQSVMNDDLLFELE